MKTYKEAKELIDQFCKLAEEKESLHFAYGFLQSFTAQCLSGRKTSHSLAVLEAIIKDLK